MKKVIRLTESDLTRIVSRVLNEQSQLNVDACVDPLNQASLWPYGRIAKECQTLKSDIMANKRIKVQNCINVLKNKAVGGDPDKFLGIITCVTNLMNSMSK